MSIEVAYELKRRPILSFPLRRFAGQDIIVITFKSSSSIIIIIINVVSRRLHNNKDNNIKIIPIIII